MNGGPRKPERRRWQRDIVRHLEDLPASSLRSKPLWLLAYSPYERPITSSMISSVPAPMRLRRMSRHTRSTPYSFM